MFNPSEIPPSQRVFFTSGWFCISESSVSIFLIYSLSVEFGQLEISQDSAKTFCQENSERIKIEMKKFFLKVIRLSLRNAIETPFGVNNLPNNFYHGISE